jgi:hypothetical protein
MGYYMGDYYSLRGGSSFYRGDPFWGFLGRLAKGAITAITGFGHSAAPKALPEVAGRAQTIGRMAGSAVGAVGSMIARHPVISAAGAAAVMGVGAGAGISHMGMVPAGHKGYHMSKPHKGVAPHLVRNRRMRVTNPHALRRAIRRAHGFARMARKCIAFTSPRPPKGRMYFKHRKAKR